MMKKLALTLTCTAIFTSLSSLAYADAISFQFVADKSAVTATAAGLTTSTTSNMIVSSTSGAFDVIPGAKLVILSTGASSNFTKANIESGGALFASGPANVIDVEIVSSACVDPGNICVSGTENGGTLSDSKAPFQNGSFQGNFVVSYVDPAILTAFGLANFDPNGSDSLDTSADVITNAKFAGTFAGADVTISGESITTSGSVPEPGSLVLLGSGLLGFAGMLRQRRKA